VKDRARPIADMAFIAWQSQKTSILDSMRRQADLQKHPTEID
jgi:hypothetical protein